MYSKAAFGTAVAREYMIGFRKAFAVLREHPMLGVTQPDLGEEVRRLGYRSHGIFYGVSDDRLAIFRILHHAQDAGTRLDR